MSQKFGASIGIALVGYLLALYGYKANIEQTQITKNGIRMMLSVYPAIGSFLASILIFVYPLKEKFLKRIEDELSVEREK
jgi:GPH family glycoside/pentoside/hexuronide:cation symporter